MRCPATATVECLLSWRLEISLHRSRHNVCTGAVARLRSNSPIGRAASARRFSWSVKLFCGTIQKPCPTTNGGTDIQVCISSRLLPITADRCLTMARLGIFCGRLSVGFDSGIHLKLREWCYCLSICILIPSNMAWQLVRTPGHIRPSAVG